jgi:putative ABC transport system ATP-binding protein
MALLRELNRGGLTLIVVTHDPRSGAYADRVIHLSDGRVVDIVTQTVEASER